MTKYVLTKDRDIAFPFDPMLYTYRKMNMSRT